MPEVLRQAQRLAFQFQLRPWEMDRMTPAELLTYVGALRGTPDIPASHRVAAAERIAAALGEPD